MIIRIVKAERPVITIRVSNPAIVTRPDKEAGEVMMVVSIRKLITVMMSIIKWSVFIVKCSIMVSAANSNTGIYYSSTSYS